MARTTLLDQVNQGDSWSEKKSDSHETSFQNKQSETINFDKRQ